jgi:hypothetical protein
MVSTLITIAEITSVRLDARPLANCQEMAVNSFASCKRKKKKSVEIKMVGVKAGAGYDLRDFGQFILCFDMFLKLMRYSDEWMNRVQHAMSILDLALYMGKHEEQQSQDVIRETAKPCPNCSCSIENMG